MKSNECYTNGIFATPSQRKNSTDLCEQLTSITQMLNEGPVDFILRCIELREKLILTSKTSGETKYDKVLVSCLSLSKVERGLESNLILQEKTPVFGSKD